MDDFIRAVLTDIIRRGEIPELEEKGFTYFRDGKEETIDQETLRIYVEEILSETQQERN
jgi:hypothetical protein